MTTTQLDGVRVNTQANVFFDGKCVSHSLTLPDGSKKSVGVVLPGTLTFNIGAPETMECVAGGCEYRIGDSPQWLTAGPGDSFSVAAQGRFEIRVSQAYHYICHFG